MILASKEKIKEYTELGWWGETTLLDYFNEHVKNMPDTVALVDPPNKEELTGFEPERITYRELNNRINALATAFINSGLQKDEIVLVQLPNCIELAMLYFAVTRAGGLITPVPMAWRYKELSYIVGLTRAKIFITMDSFKDFNHYQLGEKLGAEYDNLQQVMDLSKLREMATQDPDLEKLNRVHVDGNDVFTLCWTSGTEAEPKGCPLSHNNWINLCTMEVEVLDLAPGDVLYTAGPLVNMASVGTVFIPWIITGGTFVIHHPFDAKIFIQQLMQEKVNYTLLVPAIANAIVKHPSVDQFDLSSIRAITIGSAPPSLFTMQEFKRRWDIDIGNIWGQNEGTGIISSAKDVPDMETRVDHLPFFGRKGVGWSSRIAEERMDTKLVSPETGKEVTQPGEVGELAFKGTTIIPGYFRRQDLTDKSFDQDGYFYTGDLFTLKPDNYIGFFERKKDIIVRGGYNISAQEVENIVLAHPKVMEVAAIGIPDDYLGERTCVFVTPAQEESIELDEIVDFLQEQGIAKYKFPERLEVVEQMPRNPVGKLLKKDLKEILKARMQDEHL